MKIVRGMYESRWTAEYLRRNPNEVQDYVEFGKVIAWRRVRFSQKHFPGRITEKLERSVEDEYNKVKARFTRPNGTVRQEWSSKRVREIAKDIGRENEYELPYSLACSIHHANFEGLLSHFDFNDEEAMPEPPPSAVWIDRALLAAHTNLLFALDTLNECCKLNLPTQIEDAQHQYANTWSSRDTKLKD